MWERKIMGLTDQPYHACQVMTWDKIIAMGDQLFLENPFVQEKVVLNFHVTKEYDCQWTRMFKKSIGWILSVDLYIYVDDRRPISTTETLC